MRIYEHNWMQLEAYLQRDDRVVVPLGSTEQHAYRSLGTDSIMAERVALEAGASLLQRAPPRPGDGSPARETSCLPCNPNSGPTRPQWRQTSPTFCRTQGQSVLRSTGFYGLMLRGKEEALETGLEGF